MRLGQSLWVLLLVSCGRIDSGPPCQPQLLATLSEFESFDALALHGPNVLWTTKDGLWSLPKEGGTATKLAPCASSFAVDGEAAFCIDPYSSDLLRVPLDGSGFSTVATNVKPSIVGAESGRVFVNDGSTLSALDEATGATAEIVAAPWLVAWVVDHGFVYWSSIIDSYPPQTTINATSTATGETTTLATMSISLHFMTTNTTSLFFSGYDPHDLTHIPADTIFQMPKTGGTPQVFASPTDQGVRFSVDDATLFTVTSELGLAAFPLDGSPPTTTGVDPIADLIEVDDAHIYWTVNMEHAATFSRVCR